MSDRRILFVEICNYKNAPVGGYLTFAKQMVKAFGNQLYLVGSSIENNDPLGQWIKKDIDGVVFNYFSVRKTATNKRTLIPQRLLNYFYIKYYKKKILSVRIDNIFLQTPEAMMSLNLSKEYNVCARVPGLQNPLSISRYSYAKLFANFFDKLFYNKLRKCSLILATGDDMEIKEFFARNKNSLLKTKLEKFASRIDTKIFKIIDKNEARDSLGLNKEKIYAIVSGRLSELKGWQFIIDSFLLFNKIYRDSDLIFVGDGEDQLLIQNYSKLKGIEENIILAGSKSHKELALYLSSADIYVSGSFVEGWSTALMEAIACGLPCVTTNFSSAKDLVRNGINGFVLEDRNPTNFSIKMEEALNLDKDQLRLESVKIKKYCTSNLKFDILKLWNLK